MIKDIEDVKLIINKYEGLMAQAERLVDDRWFDEIERLECDDNDLTIYYSTYCYGETEHLDTSVPIKWLFLDDDELEKVKKEKKEEEKEIRRKQEKANKIAREEAQEQKDREEYERLKAKFEAKRKE